MSPIQDFRMTRVMSGVASSPYVVVQALQQMAQDFGDENPIAKPHICSSVYVDDLLAEADNPQAAIELQTHLRQLLLKGGFDLRKWRSSSTKVMEHISLDLHEQSALKNLTDDHSSQHQKALGMVWDASSDNFFVSIGTMDDPTPTKRGVISDIARKFDILGWISPAIICMKILFQHL